MAIIESVEIVQVDLQPKVKPPDSIQSFVVQETVFVTIRCKDGNTGTGYTYTIGTGGWSVVALLNDHLVPQLIGRNAAEYEAIWRDLFYHTHATAVGAITSLALAALDTALWDRNARGGRREGAAAYLYDRRRMAASGRARTRRADLAGERSGLLRRQAQSGAAASFGRCAAHRRRARGRGRGLRDRDRRESGLPVIRGDSPRACVRAVSSGVAGRVVLPAENVSAHRRLSDATRVPIAVGESMYHPAQFGEYLKVGACGIVQADVAGSAASRRGSRSRTRRRRSISPYVRIS